MRETRRIFRIRRAGLHWLIRRGTWGKPGACGPMRSILSQPRRAWQCEFTTISPPLPAQSFRILLSFRAGIWYNQTWAWDAVPPQAHIDCGFERESMAFTEETIEFLIINRLNDSKAWFEEHREDYLRLVRRPLEAVCLALAPVIAETDPMLVTKPSRCISRIYRDTRFARDKSIFRDRMWIAFDRDHKEFPEAPGFYFSISPDGWGYGCGFYEAPPRVMEALRALILSGDPDASRAMDAYDAQDVFAIEGPLYKRSRFPEADARLRAWLDRRDLNFGHREEGFDALAHDEVFIPQIERGYRMLVPLYTLMLKAVHRARA